MKRKRPYNIETCKRCRYRGFLDYDTQICCNYIGITGHARSLLPPREDGQCPAFEEGELQSLPIPRPMVGEPKERPEPRSPADSMADRFKQMQDLYDQGMTDREIGEEMRCSERTVSSWRRRAGLPGNGAKKKHFYDPEEFRKLYDQGYSDARISKMTGYHHSVIANWRNKNGLPPVNRGGKDPIFDRARMRELYDKGLFDSQIAKELGCTESAVKHWRDKVGLPAQTKREDLK